MNNLNINRYMKLMPQIPKNAMKPFVNSIQQRYNVADAILPVGTRLYRTAFEKDPMDFFVPKKDICYFGLDAWISIWYGLEMWQRIKTDSHELSYNKWFVHMHEYEIQEPISYTYLPDMYINPKNAPYYETCLKEPCVHPQRIFHGNQGILNEVGTELTLPYTFPIAKHLKPLKSYKVNLIRLLEMQDTLTGFSDSLESVFMDA